MVFLSSIKLLSSRFRLNDVVRLMEDGVDKVREPHNKIGQTNDEVDSQVALSGPLSRKKMNC
jgi:hypothetical protein